MEQDYSIEHGVQCPVCGSLAEAIDVVDFNKCCEEARGLYFKICGYPVYYVLCNDCGFCFAPELHRWSLNEFANNVYNSEYAKADPDYLDARPINNAKNIKSIFENISVKINHLDYGGGSGLLSQLLRDSGWASNSYDPFVDGDQVVDALGQFDLITAFEVFEHVPDIDQLMAHLSSLLRSDGIILFSTLLSDGFIKRNQRLSWWYASPRNGHISLFSKNSLSIIAGKVGLNFGSFSEGFHLFWRGNPEWAKHLLSKFEKPEITMSLENNGIETNQMEMQKLVASYYSVWHQILEKERQKSPALPVLNGQKAYSQNDEDGIIAEIFDRIGIVHHWFFEIGSGNGMENNTLFWLKQGWNGVWVDGGESNAQFIERYFSIAIEEERLHFRCELVTAENINKLVGTTPCVNQEIDLLSIDIDGNDYYVFEALDSINARVVVIEYNARFPAPLKWRAPYSAEYVWDGSDWFGASLQSMTDLFKGKGYSLVSCNVTGANAFFVRNDLLGDKFPLGGDVKALFQPPRYLMTSGLFAHIGGHVVSNQLDHVEC